MASTGRSAARTGIAPTGRLDASPLAVCRPATIDRNTCPVIRLASAEATKRIAPMTSSISPIRPDWYSGEHLGAKEWSVNSGAVRGVLSDRITVYAVGRPLQVQRLLAQTTWLDARPVIDTDRDSTARCDKEMCGRSPDWVHGSSHYLRSVGDIDDESRTSKHGLTLGSKA